MSHPPQSFNVSPDGDPYDQLLTQVREAAEGVYDVLGEMGRSKSGNVVYLAREIESKHLVALKLSRSGGAEAEFNLEVVRTLDGNVPGLENKCPECKSILPDWDRFCFRCGADLQVSTFTPAASEAAQVLEAVKEATAGEYEILGQMDRTDGRGAVFFARDLGRGGKLVALRLKQEKSGDPNQAAYSIGETQVFRPLAAELGATQVASAEDIRALMQQSATPVTPPPESTPIEVPPRSNQPREVSSRKGLPVKPLAIGVGAVLVAVIGFLVFGGDPSDEPPLTPPAPSQVPPPPVPPPVVPEPPPPPAVPPPEPVVDEPPRADSGSIVVAVRLPPGARVTVDGKPLRGTSVRVAAGPHAVSVTAEGYQPFSQRITVKPNETARWRPTLATLAQATPTPPPPGPPPAAPTNTCARAYGRSDWAVAMDLCQKEANAGDVAAMRNLGRMLEDGKGVTADRAHAASWYQRAATQGDKDSQVRLGIMYRSGSGVKKDEKQSAALFRQAAEAGSVDGQLEWAVALEEGKGVDRNEADAARWYRKAADAGKPRAATRLGRLFERGRGVAKNELEASQLYRTAAQAGDPEGAYSLGKMYKDGKGVEKSTALALEWFKKAAAMGHAQAAEEAKGLEGKGAE